MTFADELNRVLKYRWDRKEDAYPAVSDPHELTPHGILADHLLESDSHKDRDLGAKLLEEVERSANGQVPPAQSWSNGGPHLPPQVVVGHLSRFHPNPTVRAMARQVPWGVNGSPDLVNLLFHSDDRLHPHDHDAAVWLAPEDDAHTHTVSATLNKVNRGTNGVVRSGTPGTPRVAPGHNLSAKVVRGKVYLLDHEHPDRKFGAPALLYEAAANDRDEVQTLEDRANDIISRRIDGARIGGPEPRKEPSAQPVT